jgi:hypothetical protein
MRDLLGVESAHLMPTPLPVSPATQSQLGLSLITKLTMGAIRRSYQTGGHLSPSGFGRSLVIWKDRVAFEGGS